MFVFDCITCGVFQGFRLGFEHITICVAFMYLQGDQVRELYLVG